MPCWPGIQIHVVGFPTGQPVIAKKIHRRQYTEKGQPRVRRRIKEWSLFWQKKRGLTSQRSLTTVRNQDNYEVMQSFTIYFIMAQTQNLSTWPNRPTNPPRALQEKGLVLTHSSSVPAFYTSKVQNVCQTCLTTIQTSEENLQLSRIFIQ